MATVEMIDERLSYILYIYVYIIIFFFLKCKKSFQSCHCVVYFNPFPVCVPPGGHTVKVLLKIEISPNCLKIGTEPISSMLIMNMDKDF